MKDVEDSSDGETSLSSLASVASFDIEDLSLPGSALGKRRRGADDPSTSLTSMSTSIATRRSPREGGDKAEDGIERGIKKRRRQPTRKAINQAGKVEVHPPADWGKIYDCVKEMRKKVLAPVDTMGCETLAEDHLTPRVCACK